jgi:uncharacterized repeat protein (TIGR03803 family)
MSRTIRFSSGPIVACVFLLGALAFAGSTQARDIALLNAFQGNNGGQPSGGLLLGSNGYLYGTTFLGGLDNGGVVFELAPNGTETVLHQFVGGNDGFAPYGGLIADKEGNLYGTTVGQGSGEAGTVFKLAPDGTETILYAFAGGNDGISPFAGLLADKQGNLYGTTLEGGDNSEGTVFKVTPAGTETVLYSFKGGNDGAAPQSNLIADSQGNLYGTTVEGGSANSGTVFKLAPGGTETILVSFQQGISTGASPHGGLIMDGKGNLYGTATVGGNNNCQFGCGTLFEIAADDTFSVLHRFTGGKDGGYPEATLIQDKKGNFYGTAATGGLKCGGVGVGCGVVFEMTPAGTVKTLYALTGGAYGSQPYAPVTADKQGNLFGAAMYQGYSCTNYALQGCGTIFEVKK